MPSIMPKKITKAEAKVVAVDLEKREMTFYDPERDLQDTYVVRKKTRLRAHKKVFKGKPALEDFLEGDTVKITIIAEDAPALEGEYAQHWCLRHGGARSLPAPPHAKCALVWTGTSASMGFRN